MRRISKALAVALVICGSNVWADRGDQYVLGKLGFMSVDLNDADTVFSVGALYGYGLTPEITVEGELNLGLFGGKYTQAMSAGEDEKGDYRISTLAGYGVYRWSITDLTYLKGKAGLLLENVVRSAEITKKDKTARSLGIAGGIGAGTRIAETLTIEAEITGIDADIIFYSLGLHFAF